MKNILRYGIVSACLAILSFFSCSNKTAGNRDYESMCGLTFRSHEVYPDYRTSLSLTQDKAIRINRQGLILSFDIKLKKDVNSFGLICRISDENAGYLDFISNNKGTVIHIIYGENSQVLSNTPVRISSGQYNNIKIAISRDDFICSIDTARVSIPVMSAPFKKIHIDFGCINNKDYFNTDIPAFTLKNISVTEMNGDIRYFWPLDKHAGNTVYDMVASKKATVKNPEWEIDRHLQWKRIFDISLPNVNPQIAFDPDTDQMFIAYGDSIKILDISRNASETIPVKTGNPFFTVGNNMIYDCDGNRLMSYNSVSRQLRFFSFDSKSWDGAGQDSTILERQHHTDFFDSSSNTLYTFGGYGHYRYHNDFHIVNIENGEWKDFVCNDIAPRYLGAMGKAGDSLYLIGGFGSSSGKQEENPSIYYDIYKLRTDSLKFIFCGTIDLPVEKYYVFAKSFIPEQHSQTVYTVVYGKNRFNTEAQLIGIDLPSGEVREYADPIAFKFHDIESYVDVFHSEISGALLLVMAQPGESPESTRISVDSMDFPPFQTTDVVYAPLSGNHRILWIASGMLASLILISVIFIPRMIHAGKKRRQEYSPDALGIVKIPEPDIPEPQQSDFNIQLLGSFRVMSKDGTDITKTFSPMLRNIFVFLILKSSGGEEGLPQQMIDETFWIDHDYPDAINNRRVNLSKLRHTVKNINEISIKSENGIIKIDGITADNCDYVALKNELSKLKIATRNGHEINDLASLSRLISIASKGPLLPEITLEWVEDFRNDLFWRLSEILRTLDRSEIVPEILKLQIQLSNILLSYDSIDENAIGIKCRALYKLGQKGLSKQTFETFASTYKKIMDTDPDLSFKEVIKNDCMEK